MGCAKSENSDQNTAEIHEVTVSALTVQAQSISLIENLPGRVVYLNLNFKLHFLQT